MDLATGRESLKENQKNEQIKKNKNKKMIRKSENRRNDWVEAVATND